VSQDGVSTETIGGYGRLGVNNLPRTYVLHLKSRLSKNITGTYQTGVSDLLFSVVLKTNLLSHLKTKFLKLKNIFIK
jgi:hypothetical protein